MVRSAGNPRTVRKLTCQEVLDHLSEYLDEEAQAELVSQVDLHVGHCRNCRVEVDTLKHTIFIFRENERVFLPQPLTDRLQEALEQAYRQGGCAERSGQPAGEDGPTEG